MVCCWQVLEEISGLWTLLLFTLSSVTTVTVEGAEEIRYCDKKNAIIVGGSKVTYSKALKLAESEYMVLFPLRTVVLPCPYLMIVGTEVKAFWFYALILVDPPVVAVVQQLARALASGSVKRVSVNDVVLTELAVSYSHSLAWVLKLRLNLCGNGNCQLE